jgi:hypothetical protein
MKYSYFIFILMVLVVSCGQQRQSDKKVETSAESGIEIQSSSGHFTVALPPDFPSPEADTQQIATAGDSISMFTYISETKRGICIFGANEYSSRTFLQQSPEDMLENAQNAALKQWNARLTDRKPFSKNNGKGLSYWFSTTMDGKDFYGRFDYLLARPRMYQIGFLSFDKTEISKPDIQKYFNSLSVPMAQ